VTDDDALPAGWCVELDPTARRTGGGRVLVGGAPLRVLTLTSAGADFVERLGARRPSPTTPAERRLARRLVDAGLAHPRPAPDAGPAAGDVAVVVPVRDMTPGLRATLQSLPAVGEIVVVDDGSYDADAVRSATRTAAPSGVRGRVLRNERAAGPASARDRGWRATTLPIVAFVDAEVHADRDWLTRLLPHFDDPTVAAVAPRVRATPGAAPALLARYEAVRSPLDRGRRGAEVRPGSVVAYVPTTALVTRRSALEAVGGFDAALRYGEDVDLVWRLHDHGWRVRYDPTVSVGHPCRPTWSGWWSQRVAYGSSAAPLARRHGDAAAALGLSAWTGATAAAWLFGRPGSAAGATAARVVVVARELPQMEDRAREAMRVTAGEQSRAARRVADALRGPWWPLALGLGLAVRRARPALVAAALVPVLLDMRDLRPRIDPLRFAALHLADDVAYGSGVWLGALRERSPRSLLPALGRLRTRAGAGGSPRRPPVSAR
jgi:mycofactocin system glycosyltransferase